MELRHFRLIKTVVDEGSMSKAAGKLFLTQPALSHQLRELEEELGVTLFHRVRRHLVLTEAGQRVLESANSIITEIDRVKDEMKQVASGKGGKLRFASCCFTCYHFLPSLIKSFRRAFPDVDIVFNSSATMDPMGYLNRGELDVVLTTERHPAPGLTYTKVRDDELLAVIPANHPWRAKDYVVAKDFADQDLISFDAPDETSTFFVKILTPSGVKPRTATKLPAIDSMIQIVSSGLGVAVIGQWSLEQFRSNRNIATVSLGPKGLWQTWYAVTLRTKSQPIYIKRFVELLSAKTDG